MNSKYAILAIALMAAAAFVAVPLAADDSAADGDDLLIAPLLTGDDDMEEYELPTNITGEITVPAGYYVAPCDDYTIAFGAKITFSPGSQLRIDAMSPFSLEAEAGSIYFEPGSSVAMGVLDEGYSVPVTEMVAVLIDGQIDYNIEMGTGAFLVFDANLTVYDGTMVTFNHQILLFKGDTTMTANANIDMDMEDFDIEDLDDVPMHVLVDAKLTCGEITYYPDGDDEDTFVTLVSGSYQEYYLEASNPAYLKEDKATLDMEVSGKFVFDVDGTEATLTDEAEFNVVVKTGDEIEDLDVDISGSASFEIDVDDYTGDMVTVRDIALTSEVDISNNDLVAASDFQIGELTVISPYFNLSIEGFDYADSTSFKANSLDDLFSLTNILNEYAYMAEYNPSEAKDYIMGCTGAFIEVYFGEELAAEFGELLDELPPMAIYALGYENGYILSTVPVGTTLKEQFQKIYDGLGADPDFMDYMSGCTDYILKITYGIDDFEAPVLKFTEDLTLDYLMFEGFGYGLEVSGIEMASSITYSDTYECKTEASYDGADATLTFEGSIFQISLPAMSSSSVVDEDGIASDIAVEGDLKVAAVTDEGENYIMYFTVNSDDTLTMDWDSTIAFTTNDKITDVYVYGAYQTYYADTISYKMDVEIEILDIDIDVPDITGLAKLSASDLTLASIFAGDSFLLEDNFLADDLFLADDDMVGAMPNDIIANDIIPPIDIHIDANVEADVSFSMSDVLVFIPDYMGMYYNLTLDSYKMKASVSFKDENLDGEASASVKDCVASIYNGMYNIAYNVEDVNVEAEVIADNIITIDVTGDMYFTVGSGSDVADAYVMSNIEGSMDMTTDGESELNSLTFDLKIIDTGITMDFGTVTCDVDDMTFHADEVQIDGIYLDRNTPLYSMGGTVQDVKMGFSGLIPTTFESARADITFTCTTGYLVWQQTVDGNGNRVTCEVDGTFFLDTIEDVECVYGLTHPGIPGMTNHYSFIGEGMAVSNTVYYDQYGGTEMGGTVYAKEELYAGDLLLHIDFTGVALGIDARGFMTVKAQTGFTLDPTTYEGFTVNDQGYVVIDEEILEAGEGVIYAQGIGDKYTLTIDGNSRSVRYGETVDIEVGNYFLGMFDENGDAIGDVIGTRWYYTYHFLRDVSLTSVTTTPVGVVPDQIVRVTTDKFNFVVPEGEFEYIMVEVPSGMLVEFASEDVTAGEAIRVAVEQTKYDGKDAFMIHSDRSMIIEYPVSSSDVVLYHVVRGVAIPMSCMYYVLDGQTYAVAELSSYSTYYFDEKNGSGDNTYFYLAAIAIAIIVAAALCVPLYLKKKKAGA